MRGKKYSEIERSENKGLIAFGDGASTKSIVGEGQK
jgi:hypothetical protein